MSRIRHNIFMWNKRTHTWRAEVFVDNHLVAKAVFATRTEAEVWVDEQITALRFEVRE